MCSLRTDLNKAFDCIMHDVLIAKLEAYGFSFQSRQFMHGYLTDKKTRTKTSFSFSDFIDLLIGVPEGCILGALLFNIYICDFSFVIEEENFTSYADDTTVYSNDFYIVALWCNGDHY